MNDKDRLEAIKYADNSILSNNNAIQYAIQIEAFMSGCEYKQKEIEELKNVTYWIVEQDGKVTRHISIAEIEKLKAELLEYKEAATSEAALVNELQAENAKLRNDIKEILTLSFYDLQGDDLEVLNGFKSEYLK